MEYSGYVDRSTVTAAPMVNWNGILENVNKTLDANEATRAATREKQAKDTQTALEEINKMNVGQNQTGNEYITKASYQAKTLLNDAYKKYTSGQMTREQFNIVKQNTSSSFSDVNTYMKTLQDNFLKYQELSQKGELSQYSDYMQAELGKLADLSDKTMYFNPPDGKGYIATIGKDGKIDTKNTFETSWIKGGTSFFDPKVKVEDEVGKFTGKMKEFTRIMDNRLGKGIWTVEDPTARAEFDKMSSDISKSVASTPLRMASVLTDFVTDKNYTYTKDAKEAASDPSKILLVKTSSGVLQPQLTKDQIADGEAAIKRVIKSQLGYKETQVEDTHYKQEFAPKDVKKDKEPVVVTINDVKPSSGMQRGGKFVDSQKFTLKTPVVYDPTGVKQSLKAIIIDPKTGNMDLEIETPATTKSGNSTIKTVNKTTISTKTGGVNRDLTSSSDKSKLKSPDVGAINNIVSMIWDPAKNNGQGGYLQTWQELYEQKIDESIDMYNKSHPKTPLKRRGTSQTSTTNTQSSGEGVSLNANNWGK
tara:strand:+ start:9040 stop:10638 length:1599 start_codon:yes stop_codon:yes gene_type:complete